jgi:uncharacterized cofD-like protein
VVAFGGGHGLYASLSALRHLTDQLTAVVTVADDGGSSGRLRAELDVLPPGDLRMALAALCEAGEWGHTWRDVLQHRFRTDGPLNDHAVGNLLIVALWELLDDPVAGLDWVGRLLGARGRVLPMSLTPLHISADVRTGGQCHVVHGQANVATSAGVVTGIHLDPPDPTACPAAVAAVQEADWIVLGPGSWFTSVLPHLLLPELRDALLATPARRCLILNLREATDPPLETAGEEAGMSTVDLLRALAKHAPQMRFDTVLADPGVVDDPSELATAVGAFGARQVMRCVSEGPGSARHDPLRLAAALRDCFEGRTVDEDPT